MVGAAAAIYLTLGVKQDSVSDSDLNSVKQQVTTIQTAQTTNSDDVKALQAKVDALTKQVNDLESKEAQDSKDIAALQAGSASSSSCPSPTTCRRRAIG